MLALADYWGSNAPNTPSAETTEIPTEFRPTPETASPYPITPNDPGESEQDLTKDAPPAGP
jgi:hypothetical protein